MKIPLRFFALCTSLLGAFACSETTTDSNAKAFIANGKGEISTGIYTLVADDSDKVYNSEVEWSPSLHSYQQRGFNTYYLTFIRPDTMEVPPAFVNLAKSRSSNREGSIPADATIIFSIGGIAYSTSINPWPWLSSAEAAREMASKVAKWPELYGCDGIDIDIEEGAGNAANAGQNLIIFVKELKRLNPQIKVTLPVYGFPQVRAANELVNAAFSPDGIDHGLLDSIGIMVYEDTQALNYVGNYAKIDGHNRWEGFPITAAVPKEKIVLGLKGTASDSTIKSMSDHIKNMGLGGFMVWYGSLLDQGQTALQYPPSWDASTIQSAEWANARATFGEIVPAPQTPQDDARDPTQQPDAGLGPVDEKPEPVLPDQNPVQGPGSPVDQQSIPKVSVGYFTSWSIYQRNYFVSDIPADKLTHINYAFVNVTSDLRCTLGDTYADIEKSFDGQWQDGRLQGNFGELIKLKERYPHLKTLIALGGWTWSKYFSVAARPEHRQQFVESCIKIMRDFHFDGIDVDWEYPVAGGLEGNITSPDDTKNFVELLKLFRERMGDEALLTVATSAGDDKIANLDLPSMARYIDWFNVMTYDFHGGWERTTHHNAPLFGAENETYTLDYAIQHYLNNQVPKHQIVVGLPFYGRGRTQVAAGPQGNGLFQPAGGRAQGSWEAEVFDYKDLTANYIGKNGFQTYWDDLARVPFLYNPNSGIFISYDDQTSIAEKVDYTIQNDLRGIMVWSLDSDNGDLMNTIHQKLKPYQQEANNGSSPVRPVEPPLVVQPDQENPSQDDKPNTDETPDFPDQNPGEEPSRLFCEAVGLYQDVPGMVKWCMDNCQNGFCPETHCYCTSQ